MTGTAVTIIPSNFQLPAYLQTEDALKAVAKANAEAAGGIKAGGFPRISIRGGKFHIKKAGQDDILITAPPPSPPGLPLMQLEMVIVAANPAIVKTFYPGAYKDGDDGEPTCSSDNGVVPDPHITAPQNAVCATCPQNQWGSKISKSSGKEVKACSDSKRIVVIPSADLGYEALGISITPAALTDFGRYVKALTDKNVPLNAVVTNITFDHTAAFPRLQFAFGRVLSAEEYARVLERAKGDDVKNIVSQSRPATVPALAAPAPAPAAPVNTPPVAPIVPPAAPAQPPAPFGIPAPATPLAAPVTTFAAPPGETPAVPRTRAPRKPKETPAEAAPAAPGDPLGHIPPEVRGTIALLGADSELGKALIAKYPAPPPAAVAATPVVQAPPVAPVPAAAAPFGTPPVETPASPQAASAAVSLKEQLEARMRANGQVPQAAK